MRALCGAIITAGALIGLGLACVGVGYRYQGDIPFVAFRQMDTALAVGFVVLIIAVLIGLGVAFVGLAYHHHHRTLELHRTHGTATTTPPTTGTGERASA